MVLAARRFDHERSMARIDADVDRTRWLMPPQARRPPVHAGQIRSTAARVRAACGLSAPRVFARTVPVALFPSG